MGYPVSKGIHHLSRAERLLDLLQILRLNRYPVSGSKIADELGVSLRTVYRDIASLQAQGARIDGEPGVGYMLRPGFMLPPLMFSEDEIEALVLGSRWVADRADPRLGAAARHLMAKIAAVLPADLREKLDATALLVPSVGPEIMEEIDLSIIRHAIRGERKLRITYRDLKDNESERIIWPFALAFFDRARVIAAWCESRNAYRHFRADRIVSAVETGEKYSRRRQTLLQEWREQQGIPTQ